MRSPPRFIKIKIKIVRIIKRGIVTPEEGFSSIKCNHCGWCCQRTPCSLGVYLGTPIQGPCQFLLKEKEEYFCGLIKREVSEMKKLALQQLIMAGEGCSHKFGPHPVSLLKMLLQMGLVIGSSQWQMAKQATRQEMIQFAKESADPKSMTFALEEFDLFCKEKEEERKAYC